METRSLHPKSEDQVNSQITENIFNSGLVVKIDKTKKNAETVFKLFH